VAALDVDIEDSVDGGLERRVLRPNATAVPPIHTAPRRRTPTKSWQTPAHIGHPAAVISARVRGTTPRCGADVRERLVSRRSMSAVEPRIDGVFALARCLL